MAPASRKKKELLGLLFAGILNQTVVPIAGVSGLASIMIRARKIVVNPVDVQRWSGLPSEYGIEEYVIYLETKMVEDDELWRERFDI